MRTDSTRLSPDAVAAAREYIGQVHGPGFVPAQPNVFKSKKGAQDAHEAIRPTSLELTPASVRRHLKDDQLKLYRLIWERFLASQMTPAVYDQTGVDIEAIAKRQARSTKAEARAAASSSPPAGSRPTGAGDASRPPAPLAGEGDVEAGRGQRRGRHGNGQRRGATSWPRTPRGDCSPTSERGPGRCTWSRPAGRSLTEQKFTQPPPRYNEGSLVRELEDRGIGRPSTYAEIISKVQGGGDYVEKIDGGALPAHAARQVRGRRPRERASLDFMDPAAFTSKMEEERSTRSRPGKERARRPP